MACVVVAIVLASCSAGGDVKGTAVALDRPTPTPTPTSPTPTPTPEPVQGAVSVSAVDASAPTRLGFPDDPAPDEDAAAAIATRLATSLDRHLTALQVGGDDLEGLAALWTAADDATLASVTSSLASPDLAVRAAAYDVVVLFESGPTLAVVTATIDRDDDTTVVLDLVFDVSGRRPLLQLVGDGAPAGRDGGSAAATTPGDDA